MFNRSSTGNTMSMSEERHTETAILAGGCFWGMQDLMGTPVGQGVALTRAEESVRDIVYRMFEEYAQAMRDTPKTRVQTPNTATAIKPAKAHRIIMSRFR